MWYTVSISVGRVLVIRASLYMRVQRMFWKTMLQRILWHGWVSVRVLYILTIHAAGSLTLHYMPSVVYCVIFQLDFAVGSSLNDHRADLR